MAQPRSTARTPSPASSTSCSRTLPRAATSAGRFGGYGDGGGRTYQFAGTKGLQIGDGGFVNFNIDRLYNRNVDRSEADWRQLFPNGDPRNDTFDKKYGQWGQSQRDNWAGLINSELPLTENLRAYGWVNYSDKSALNYVNPERVVKANTQSPTATTPNRVSETAVLGVYPDGYQPYMTYVARDAAAAGGLKFSTPSLGSFDFGISYGRNETARYTDSTINPSYGPDSPTSFYLGSWKGDTTSVTLDYLRNVDWLDESVVSAGALYRHEEWKTGDLGDPLGYTSGPLGGRTVASLYGPGGIYSQYAAQFPGVNFATDTSVIPATGSSTAGIQPIDAGSISRDVKGAYRRARHESHGETRRRRNRSLRGLLRLRQHQQLPTHRAIRVRPGVRDSRHGQQWLPCAERGGARPAVHGLHEHLHQQRQQRARRRDERGSSDRAIRPRRPSARNRCSRRSPTRTRSAS